MSKLSFIPWLLIAALVIVAGAGCVKVDSNIFPNQANIQTVTSSNQTPVSQTNSLDLSRQKLDKVPSYVFKLTYLAKLDLSQNQLTGAIQAEIRFLSKLRELDLSDNQMTGLPAEVGQLSQLEVLDLANNQLTGLPYELANLKKLRVLDLRGNNYAKQDLAIIKKGLSSNVQIKE